MEIIFLGTAGTVPTETRSHPAVVLEHLQEYFLFDCGEGTQRQMRLAKINPMRIDRIFITHLHADHILGLGGLIRSLDFMGRGKELYIYGPGGIEEILRHVISIGIYRPHHFDVKIVVVEKGVVMEGKGYTITSAPTKHTENVNSVAYCFEEHSKRTFLKQKALDLGVPEGRLFSRLQHGHSVEIGGKVITPDDVLSDPIAGRKVVYTGDTKPCEGVIKLAENADVLIHDSTFSDDDRDKAEEMGHSTTKMAADIAKKAGVKALYLIHISQRYTDPKKLEREAREIFENSFMSEDFMRVGVEKHW